MLGFYVGRLGRRLRALAPLWLRRWWAFHQLDRIRPRLKVPR
jgi:hypothetical protein